MSYYDNQNYYDILGVKQDATINNIKEAKDRLKFGDPDDRAPFSMWEKIDEAYKVLSDPLKRAEYDKSLQGDNNIYSSSDHKLHSLMDEMYSSSELDVDLVLPELKKIGREIVLALPTAVLDTVKVIKEIKKYKLIKDQDEKNIEEVKTIDSELIEEYRKKLDEKIDKVLTQYHYNYDLTIYKLKYENYIELLNKRIEMKENEVAKKGRLIIYKLQLTALRRQLKYFKISLEKVNNKIKQMEQGSNKKIIALKKL